jgi:hypothetical protein
VFGVFSTSDLLCSESVIQYGDFVAMRYGIETFS